MENIVAAILFGAVALGAYVFSVLQFLQKGFLLNNAYLYATKEERARMNKTPYYRQSGVMFCLVGTIFVINAIASLWQADWLFGVVMGLCAVAVAYAILSAVWIAKKNRGE